MTWHKYPDEIPPQYEWLLIAKDNDEETVFQFAKMYKEGWQLFGEVGPANGDMEWHIKTDEIKYWTPIEYPANQFGEGE